MTREMKDSGVAWIGEIPQGWEIKRMKDCFISNSRPQPNKTVLSLSYGKVIVKDMEKKKGVTPESYDSYQGVYPGDVILRLTDLQNDQKSLRVGRATEKGIITSAYLCVSSRTLNDRYMAYILHDAGDIQKLFYGLGGGVRQAMKFADLAELLFSLPPSAEQLAIANYLDRQTALIDQRLITLAEKKAVLAKLRKATIHEAVTQGSTWNAETGLVEGLPIGWEASQAKRLIRFITSGSRGWAEYYADEGDIFLRIGNLTRETIGLDLSDVQYVHLPANVTEGSRTRVREGDMLVSITADLGSIAVAPKLDKPAYVNQHIALCRPKSLVHPRWLGYAMVSLQSKQQMLNSGYGGTKIQLSLDDVRHVWLAVPPLAEQLAIADHLDLQTQQFNAQLATLDEQAQVLRELRKAIIHEAVTGKIDLTGTGPTPPQPKQALAA